MSQLSKEMNASFNKCISTFQGFIANIRQDFDNVDELSRAALSKRMNKTFAEKIMNEVSSVNGCRYFCMDIAVRCTNVS